MCTAGHFIHMHNMNTTLAALTQPDLDPLFRSQYHQWHGVYWVLRIHARHESFEPQREHRLLFVQREVLADAASEG